MNLRRFLSPRPTRVFKFRFENADWTDDRGEPHFREIAVPVGAGRLRRGSERAALELAEQRLSEQYGDALLAREAQIRERVAGHVDEAAERLRDEPRLHQSNYRLVATFRR